MSKLTIPNSVTTIGAYAFSGCKGLTELTLGNSVSYIDGYAFENCSKLTEVTLPNSVGMICIGAFYGTSLSNVVSLSTTPPDMSFGDGFSERVYMAATLYVPVGSQTLYRQAKGWKKFWNVQEGLPTAIEAVSAELQKQSSAIYTLDGKRMSTTNTAELPSGIYIVGGKKVVVK